MIGRNARPALLVALTIALVTPSSALAAAPVLTLSTPANGQTSNNTSPTFSGTADPTPTDSPVTVNVATDGAMRNLARTLSAQVNSVTGAFQVTTNGPLAAGTYFAQASQTNASNQTGTSSVNQFTIQSPPSASTQSATSVTFDAAALNGIVNPDAADTTVHFDYGTTAGYGSSTPGEDVGSGAQSVLASAGVSGLKPATTYHFRVVATSGQGTTYGADQSFVTPPAPAPTAAFIPDSGTVLAGSAVQFNATPSSDPDTSITSYSWNFGDGSGGSGVRTTHTFTKPGTYTVLLTVTDSFGKTSTIADQLSVIAPPPIQTLIETIVPAPSVIRFARPSASLRSGLVDLGVRLFCPGAGPACQTTLKAAGQRIAYTTRVAVSANHSFELVLLLATKGLQAVRAHKRLPLKVMIVSARGAEQTIDTINTVLKPAAVTKS